MSDSAHVQLGQHTLPVYSQTPARIVKRLGRVLDAFRAASTGDDGEPKAFDPAQLIRELQWSQKLYYVIETFVPNIRERMAEYELLGYSSREAFDAGDYNEDQDVNDGERKSISPTFPQYLEALDVIVKVNGGERFIEMLGKALDVKMIKAEMTLTVSDAFADWREERRALRSGSSNSRSTTDGSDTQTSSGRTDQTSDELDTSELDAAESRSGIPLSV